MIKSIQLFYMIGLTPWSEFMASSLEISINTIDPVVKPSISKY